MLKKGKRYDVTMIDGRGKSINYGWLVKSVKGSLVAFETSDGELVVNTHGPGLMAQTPEEVNPLPSYI